MGKSQRDKGSRGEREARAALEGIGLTVRKLSGMYVEGPDLLMEGVFAVEVKRRNTNRGFALIENLVTDEANDVVMVRADRGEWVVSMAVDTLAEIMAYAAEAGYERSSE